MGVSRTVWWRMLHSIHVSMSLSMIAWTSLPLCSSPTPAPQIAYCWAYMNGWALLSSR